MVSACDLGEDDEYRVEVAKVVDEGGLRAVEPREIASTIAHELVHIKQYIRRELTQGATVWKGQKIPVGPRGGTIRVQRPAMGERSI